MGAIFEILYEKKLLQKNYEALKYSWFTFSIRAGQAVHKRRHQSRGDEGGLPKDALT